MSFKAKLIINFVMQLVYSVIFKKENGDREGVPNIVILITDGRSNIPSLTASEAGKV